MQLQTAGQQGYTLVELMIVVVIVGVISAIAIPAYQQHLVDTRRKEAQSALLSFASSLERYRMRNGSYLGAANGNIPAAGVFPSQAPLDSSTKHYNLRIMAATLSYQLSAVPIDGSPQVKDGALTLNSEGVNNWD